MYKFGSNHIPLKKFVWIKTPRLKSFPPVRKKFRTIFVLLWNALAAVIMAGCAWGRAPQNTNGPIPISSKYKRHPHIIMPNPIILWCMNFQIVQNSQNPDRAQETWYKKILYPANQTGMSNSICLRIPVSRKFFLSTYKWTRRSISCSDSMTKYVL